MPGEQAKEMAEDAPRKRVKNIYFPIINRNQLSKIIKKTLKNFGGFKICYTFALCKTKTPA